MKHALKLAVTLFAFILLQMCLLAQAATPEWWRADYPQYEESPSAKTLPLISVEGNKFVSAAGEDVVFRGIAISDPDKLEKEGLWSKKHFEKVKEMGATIVRVPVHPVAWHERTPDKYFELLDQAVEWCTQLGMYVIIDWHSIGNLESGLFQHQMYKTDKQDTYEFWNAVAAHFKGHNTIAFYELFNEPTNYNGNLGRMYWKDWKETCENIITIIRSFDNETIPLVAGFDWAFDLTPVRYNPIDAESVAYVTHPYAFKRSEPYEARWDENFGFAKDKYPVFATEFGVYLEDGEEINENHYANRIVKYLGDKGISWCAWVFDPEWHPQMLKSWDTYELTDYGKFLKEVLHK